MEFWVSKTKESLLKSEKENVTSRLLQWESIVNECTKNEHMRVFKCDQTDLLPLPHYTQPISTSDMNNFLCLILRWTGLKRKMAHPSKVPKTYKDYLNKSKNWMNGSRAKHYSRTLYPHMIDCAKYYAQSVANILFPTDRDSLTSSCDGITNENLSICNLRSIQKQCNVLFRDILMYSYLVQFAQCRLRVTKIGRRVYLLCDNSMTGHKSNPMAQMLQKYAQTHPYVEQFPSHREEIVDYFNEQKEASFNQLFLLFQKRKTMEYTHEHALIHNTLLHSENILNLMQFISSNSKSKDGASVNIDKDTFDAIMSVGVTLENQQKENEQQIRDLEQYLNQLESRQTRLAPPLPRPQQQVNQCPPPPELEPDPPYFCTQYNTSCAPSSDPFIVNEFADDINMLSDKPTCYPITESCLDGLSPWRDDLSMCEPFGKCESSSYIAPSNFNNFASKFNEFECDDSTIMHMPMSVDNQLVFNTHNNDEMYANCSNFNDSDLKYDNMYFSSSSNNRISDDII
eukprot:116774_1